MFDDLKRIMKSNELKFWVYFALIIVVYGSVYAYLCVGMPSEPNNIKLEQEGGKGNPVELEKQNTDAAKSASGKVYLSEITNFYQFVITILFAVIGVILVVNFLYLHHISKTQAEEMAREALKGKSFEITLGSTIAKVVETTIEGTEIPNVEGLEDRVKWLEEQMNIQSYEVEEEEDYDGDN